MVKINLLNYAIVTDVFPNMIGENKRFEEISVEFPHVSPTFSETLPDLSAVFCLRKTTYGPFFTI